MPSAESGEFGDVHSTSDREGGPVTNGMSSGTEL